MFSSPEKSFVLPIYAEAMAHASKTVFVKLRQNIDFETKISIITAILNVELVFF
jgi:hypothetical protein